MTDQYAVKNVAGVVVNLHSQPVGEIPPHFDGGFTVEKLSVQVSGFPVQPCDGAKLFVVGGALEWDCPLIDRTNAAIAKTYIDVDAVYEAAIGRRATEYADAESEARAYAAAGYTGVAGEYVAGFARRNPTGIVQTSQWAAQQIMGRADAFNNAALSMRTTRFDRQADMRAATTAAELATAVTAWNNFIATTRAQLGV